MLGDVQKQCLDRLCAALERKAFAEAREALLALTATPDLVPHLLPAFVPHGLRMAQKHSRYAHLRRDALLQLEASADEASFREALSELLAECLMGARVDVLARLDETTRQNTQPRWTWNHWRLLEPAELMACLPEHSHQRTALLSLASFHGDGYMRELAITHLSEMGTGEELPFLLLRLNDWVAPVQARAQRAVLARLSEDYAPHFAACIVLFERLLNAQRNQLTSVVRAAQELLLTPAGRAALTTQCRAPDRLVRGAALRLLAEHLEGEERWQVLHRALHDADAGTRMWAARIACAAGRYLTELQSDPCGSIRVWALRARVEREHDGAVASLRSSLLDRSASVRACAKFHLKNFDPALSPAEFYREKLEQDSPASLLATVIAGLADVGERDDAALIALHMNARSSVVAKAAIRTCARLARADCTRDFLRALRDARPGVSSEAREALRVAWVAPAELQALVRDAEHTHSRLNGLALVEQQALPDALVGLLDAAQNERPAVQEAALRRLRQWFARSGPYRPSLPQPQRDSALAMLDNVADLALRESIRQALQLA